MPQPHPLVPDVLAPQHPVLEVGAIKKTMAKAVEERDEVEVFLVAEELRKALLIGATVSRKANRTCKPYKMTLSSRTSGPGTRYGRRPTPL